MPLFQGKPRSRHFQPIADKIKAKLSTWKGSLLSIIGRVQLVQPIIHGMIAYSFHVYSWPISLIKTVESWIRNFIWSGDIYSRKLVTVALSRVCSLIQEGGLGVRSLRAINNATMLKLCWEVQTSNGQCAKFLRARFFRSKGPAMHYIKSSIWPSLKPYLHFVQEGCKWILGDGQSINF